MTLLAEFYYLYSEVETRRDANNSRPFTCDTNCNSCRCNFAGIGYTYSIPCGKWVYTIHLYFRLYQKTSTGAKLEHAVYFVRSYRKYCIFRFYCCFEAVLFKLENVAVIAKYCHLRPPDAIAFLT